MTEKSAESSHVEASLERREAILEAVSFAAERFLETTWWEESIRGVLEGLGRATGVSRVYVFETHASHAEPGGLLMSQRYEWAAPGIEPQIDNPDLQNLSYVDSGLERWKGLFSRRKPVRGRVRDFPKPEQAMLAPYGTLHVVMVPIFVNQDWWGFIGFDECREERDWSAMEIDAVKTAANILGAAIHRKRAEITLQQRNRELAMVSRASQAFSSSLDLGQVLDAVLEEMHTLLAVLAASFWLFDPETGELECQLAKGPQSDTMRGWRLAAGQGLAGWVAQTGQSLIVPDARADQRHFKGVDQETGLPVRSVLSIPLQAKETIIGVLQLVDSRVGRFSPEELTLLEPIAAAAAIAIENARLHTAVQVELDERKRVEEALRQLNEALEQRVAERTQALQAEIGERKRIETELRQSHEELITLNAVSIATSQARNLRRILDVTLDLVLATFGPAAGHIQLTDEETGALSLAVQRGFSVETAGLIQANAVTETIQRTGWRPLASVPLKFKDNILGHMEIFDREPRQLELSQIQLLQAIGRQVGVAIQNEHLVKEAAEAKVLQALDRLRSELISNVSHELRTPLGLIKAASTTLLAEDVIFDPDIQRTLLKGIDEETDRLEHIVSNLLDLSRLEQSRLGLVRSRTDIGQLSRRVIQALQVQSTLQPAKEAGLCRVVHRFPADPLIAEVDAKRVEQVLRNLLSNALKYSPEGGTITVKGQRQEQHLHISVNDQGIGIPPDDLERVFERFYRVKHEAIQDASGAGLGLAISRGIVEAHGGRIWAESEPGKGSTFYFTLPAEA